MRLATGIAVLLGMVGAAGSVRAEQAGGKPGGVRACSILTKAEVKTIVAPNDKIFDMLDPDEEPLPGGGSSCSYSNVHVQINPFTPARLEALRKQKGRLWTAVSGVGDAAYLFDNKNAGGHYAELYARSGPHVVTVQMDVTPDTASADTVRPAAVALVQALLAKLR